MYQLIQDNWPFLAGLLIAILVVHVEETMWKQIVLSLAIDLIYIFTVFIIAFST